MRRINRNTTGLLLRRLVDIVIRRKFRTASLSQHLGDRRSQGRLAMIHMANRPNIRMRLPFAQTLLWTWLGFPQLQVGRAQGRLNGLNQKWEWSG